MARFHGYKLFAIQNERQCFGGADDKGFMRYGESKACNEEGTGGSWVNQVYRIKEEEKEEEKGKGKDLEM